MIFLLITGTVSLSAALCLLGSGLGRTHKMVMLLLSFDSAAQLALLLAPSLWSPQNYVLVNGGLCLLSAGVGLEIARRAGADLSVSFDAGLLAACAFFSMLIALGFQTDDMLSFKPMIAVYVATAGVLSLAAQRAHVTDHLDQSCLWGLAATRWLQAIRLGLMDMAPPLSMALGACADLAWCAWVFMVCWHSFSAVGGAKRP